MKRKDHPHLSFSFGPSFSFSSLPLNHCCHPIVLVSAQSELEEWFLLICLKDPPFLPSVPLQQLTVQIEPTW